MSDTPESKGYVAASSGSFQPGKTKKLGETSGFKPDPSHAPAQKASMAERRMLIATTHAYKLIERATAPLRLWTRSFL